jgi:hypothetical protein
LVWSAMKSGGLTTLYLEGNGTSEINDFVAAGEVG